MSGFHIGIDLDNTIINYDDAFVRVGVETGLLRPDSGLRTKDEVKSFLITAERGERDWMRLQGQMYGRHIGKAQLHDGVAEFLQAMRRHGACVSIVSHKTKHGHFDAEANLWDAARDWLDRQGFFSGSGFGLDPENLHFLETRDEKIATIAAVGCQAFVDDLPEVLLHPLFPAQTERFWLAGSKPADSGDGLVAYRDWAEIRAAIEPLVLARQRPV
jgi:hypothetical protein